MRFIIIIAVLFLGLGGPVLSQDDSFYKEAPKPFGIILMGASWCPYCKRAAIVLQPLAINSDIEVLVVSWDNKPVKPFKEFVPAHTSGPFSKLKTLPTTVLVDIETNSILGLFEGFKNPNDYARRLRKLVRKALQNDG